LSALKIHLDEDADAHALLKALRHRGLDITSSRERGLLRCLEEEQLAWANEQRRAIYTLLRLTFAGFTLHSSSRADLIPASLSVINRLFQLVKRCAGC
jgi:Domain of unknown function (DUF5615)